jgi:hypothetical protein
MIKINNRFRIEQDRYNTILIETYLSTNKDTGQVKDKERETYYPTLEKACHAILDKSAMCETAQGIIDKIEEAKREIVLALRER